MTTALEGGEGSASHPGRSSPLGKTRYPLYRRVDGPQGRSGHVRKISPPPEFDPRIVQSVYSRYTDYATRPNVWRKEVYKMSALVDFVVKDSPSWNSTIIWNNTQQLYSRLFLNTNIIDYKICSANGRFWSFLLFGVYSYSEDCLAYDHSQCSLSGTGIARDIFQTHLFRQCDLRGKFNK